MRREDAVRFLDRVQQRLASRPQDYADFLNIMKNAFKAWLFGELGKAGLKMPKNFDLKGIFSIALQVLGLTEENIFKRLELKIGKDNTEKVKFAWEAIKAFMKEGVEGLWKFAEKKLDKVREMVMEMISMRAVPL